MSEPKRPRGRPVEGAPIEVRLPADVIEEADRRAKAQGIPRARLLREILIAALRRHPD